MKKKLFTFICLVIVVALLFTLCACGNSSDSGNSASSNGNSKGNVININSSNANRYVNIKLESINQRINSLYVDVFISSEYMVGTIHNITVEYEVSISGAVNAKKSGTIKLNDAEYAVKRFSVSFSIPPSVQLQINKNVRATASIKSAYGTITKT